MAQFIIGQRVRIVSGEFSKYQTGTVRSPRSPFGSYAVAIEKKGTYLIKDSNLKPIVVRPQ